ncbi:MAG: hypothetical protein JJU29_18010 [Verrucomicrobia bacterium]|nr:hypothetical protein [Verrucomicrobiota bacterium]MCH8513930.1 FapA family protein [Kiritimatiellia bacterium]
MKNQTSLLASDNSDLSFHTRREGGALVTVVMMTLVMSIVLGSLASVSRQRVHTFRRESDRIRALSISEAGLHNAIRALAADASLLNGNGLVTTNPNFSNGSYQVVITKPNGMKDDIFLLTSTGQYRNQTRVSAATIAARVHSEETETPTGPTLTGAFGPAALFAGAQLSLQGGTNVYLGEYGAHATGSVVMSGSANFHGKYVSTNGPLTLNGNPQLHLDGGAGFIHADGTVTLKGTINGSQIFSSSQIVGDWGTNTQAEHVAPNVSYPAWYSPAPSVTQQQVPTSPIMNLPPIDVDAYRAHAQAHEYYFEGNQTLNRSWLTKDIRDRTGENVTNNRTDIRPAGGVFFVDGNVNLSSDMEMYGMIIATGNIQVNGNSTLINVTEFPALISVNGNITINGGATAREAGWVYAMNGNVTANGGANGLTGIVAAKNIFLGGGFNFGTGMETSFFTWPGRDTGDDAGTNDGEVEISLVSWIR